jgi:hypothetical protein
MTPRPSVRWAVVVFLAPITFVACRNTTGDVGVVDGGGADAGLESAAPDGGQCCKPDPHPSCCMSYGGWSTGRCAEECDGMPEPSDPGWKIEIDSHGCEQWTNPNDFWNGGTRNAATAYCGISPNLDAGSDAASDAATD